MLHGLEYVSYPPTRNDEAWCAWVRFDFLPKAAYVYEEIMPIPSSLHSPYMIHNLVVSQNLSLMPCQVGKQIKFCWSKV